MKNLVTLGIIGLGVACQDSSVTELPQPNEEQLGVMVAGPEQPLPDELSKARLAFRSSAQGFEARHYTHTASVIGDSLHFVPRHWTGTEVLEGAPVRFFTRSVARGATELEQRVVSATLEQGTVLLSRPAVTERFENRDDGVEQSWLFQVPPDGNGDLAVRVGVTGYTDVATTSTGIHFHNQNKLGARYSHAVWRDAIGEAWDLPVTWDGGEIVVNVPSRILDSSVFPAVLDPTVSSENAVDSAVSGFTGDQARDLSVAFSGTNYLVVWSDNRNGSESDIFGTRVAADGTILDAFGLAISTAALTQNKPVVAWVGTKWVVAWDNGGNIEAATVGPQGPVAQLGVVSATAAVETNPAIAARGTEALLVWQSDSDVRGARFTGNSFAGAIDIAVTGGVEATPTVGADPAGGYLVAWAEGSSANDVRAQLLTGAGALDGAAFTVTDAPGAQLEPAASFNGTDFVLAWTDRNDISAARVSTAGVVLDTHLEGTPAVARGGITISAAAGVQNTPAVSCDPTSCFVAWADRRNLATTGVDLFGQRTGLDLVLVGGELLVTAGARNQIQPAIAATSSGWLTVWEDQRNGKSSAAGSRISAAGAVLDGGNGIVFNTSRNGQRDPAYSAAAGGGFLQVWSDSRSYGDDIMAVRYNASGTKIDTLARTVSSGSGDQMTPSVSFDGTQYVVVWSDNRNPNDDIFAARMATDGTLLDAAGIPVAVAANRQLVPDVASGGGVSLVVWQDRRNGGVSGFDIYGAIITPAGTVAVADIVINESANDQSRPAVTFDPANNVFVVVWTDDRVASNPEVFATRVSVAGAVLDGTGVQVTAAANGQLRPDIAASGGQLLVVWDDRRNETIGDIFGARLSATGGLTVVQPDISIATTNGQANPTVTGTVSGKWAVAWVDSRNSATTLDDLFGNEVSATGVVGTEFAISTTTEAESNPRFQNDVNAANKVFLVYQRVKPDIKVQRVFRRSITYTGDQGQSCSQDAQCSSGFCVDGFCCDQACGGTQNQLPRDCLACSVARGSVANGTCSIAAAGQICRGLSGGSGSAPDSFCDLREYCDGVNPTCPDDLGRNEGQACTGTCGTGVCPANDATGAPHFCDCP